MTEGGTLLDRHYAFRDEIVERLVVDLQGPRAMDEVLHEAPLDRYVTGILWPSTTAQERTYPSGDPEFQDDVDAADERGDDAVVDLPVAASRMTAPSSIGLTFTIDPALATSMTLRTRAARYSPVAVPEAPDSTSWQRVPAELPDVTVSLADPDGRPRTEDLVDGLQVYVLARRPDPRGLVTVTAALRNTHPKPTSGLRDAAAWFQVSLEARTAVHAMVDRRREAVHVPSSTDTDLRSSALLYRNVLSFGAGHGCAAYWDEADIVNDRVSAVRTEFVPREEVRRAKASGSSADLSIESMYSKDRGAVLAELERLCEEYEVWISARERGASIEGGMDHVVDALRETANSHFTDARSALARVRAGIDLLRKDDLAFEAFRLANEAMHIQRSRQDWARRGGQGEFRRTAQSWRPFQIAFVLLNLPSVTDRHHPERSIADLLWFPAGGGKTEAYLALIAYLIVLRRLRDPHVRGTAVIMRYTLRLLTIQQFERAAMLICSLEHLRRESEGRLGDDSFGIGLWVGMGSTPNNRIGSHRALAKIRRGEIVETENPVQLKACPWCATRLEVDDYSQPTRREPLVIRCPSADCEFGRHDGLPVHVIDEDIYEVRPELVIGTVDKFARMAWDERVAALFGRTGKQDIGPDLIVQDELHLISGPLGSTVGLFETAVDLAAGRETDHGRTRPKVIASTATIRRSEQQICSVFDRRSRLFPPPALAPDTSFFAEPSVRNELGTRQYLGVMAPGTSHATLMIRVYASLLNSVHAARERGMPDDVLDPYWTLIGYFNSLRVLGSARLQVTADVEERLKQLAARDAHAREPRAVAEGLFELTSRVSSSEIPATLKALENPVGGHERPHDVVIATNMISVGLDVDRLGLMAVMGQPPSSSEYIQATSRIGRKHPGLVVTIFNSAKSRDRSHYEAFTDFHRALYRAVEATSATPFATRSRDRALRAVFVAALRMTVPTLRADGAARNFDPDAPEVQEVRRLILDRASAVAGPAAKDGTRRDLNAMIEAWVDAISGDMPAVRVYTARKMSDAGLLVDAGEAAASSDHAERDMYDPPWATPNSMRDIDAESALRIISSQRFRATASAKEI